MKVEQRIFGGGHVNQALGFGGSWLAAWKPIEIPRRDTDDLCSDTLQEQQDATNGERQPPQILLGIPLLGPAGRPLP